MLTDVVRITKTAKDAKSIEEKLDTLAILLVSNVPGERLLGCEKMAEFVDGYIKQHSALTEVDVKVLVSFYGFLQLLGVRISAEIYGVDYAVERVDMKQVVDWVNQFDSNIYMDLTIDLMRYFAGLYVEKGWLTSARVLLGCIRTCQQGVENGQKTLPGGENLTSAYLVVLVFENDLDAELYLKQLLSHPHRCGSLW